MKQEKIQKLLDEFKLKLTPNERYSSFDYCYNYFHSFRKNPKELASKKNLHLSCLHLGFYLASWGMLRGSSFLLQKSIKHFEPLIKEISKSSSKQWEIDVPNYNTGKNIEILEKCYNMIKEKLDIGEKQSRVLVTKVMLGVYGCTPAFDTYFCKSLKDTGTFNRKSLEKIFAFYTKHKDIIEQKNNEIKTYNLVSGKYTNRKYPTAKIIDMIHFKEGIKIDKKEKRSRAKKIK